MSLVFIFILLVLALLNSYVYNKSIDNINSSLGFRTMESIKNLNNWNYANRTFYKLFSLFSIVGIGLSIVMMIINSKIQYELCLYGNGAILIFVIILPALITLYKLNNFSKKI